MVTFRNKKMDLWKTIDLLFFEMTWVWHIADLVLFEMTCVCYSKRHKTNSDTDFLLRITASIK